MTEKKQRLQKSQKEKLIEWISEGLETDEINRRASELDEPFEVTRQQVGHYRKTRGVSATEVRKSAEAGALKSGLALRCERVKKLKLLAERMEEDILGERLWVQDQKIIGSGDYQTLVNFEEFNAAEVAQYRATLDDIAKEVGERRQKLDVKINAQAALAELLGIPPDELPADPHSHA